MYKSMYVLIFVIHWSYILCMLLVQISAEFRRLQPVFQEVITDITKKMGSGMCVFLEDKVGSMKQWDEVHTIGEYRT